MDQQTAEETRARTLIDAGAPLSKITHCFSTSLEAYRYYAATLHHRFASTQADQESECACCKGPTDDKVQQIAWRAITHDRSSGLFALVLLLMARITSYRVEVRFTTNHRYCASCSRRLWWTFSLLRSAKTILFAFLLLALFVTVPFVVFTGVVLFSATDLLPRMCAYLTGGLVLLLLIFLCFRWLWTSAVPLHLRFVARFPFEPLNIRAVTRRNAG